jgi:MFS family permease
MPDDVTKKEQNESISDEQSNDEIVYVTTSSEGSDAEDSKAARLRTLRVVNMTNVINSADGSLYPIVMPQIQASLHLPLDQLGLASSIGSLLQAVTTPMWGWANDKYSRKKVLGIGCLIWGVLTILMAFSMHFFDMLLYRLFTGVGLAVIVPTAYSLIADYIPAPQRGKAYGVLGLTGLVGMVIGAVIATIIVNQVNDIVPGLDNWRLVFMSWGAASVVIAALVFVFAKDPARGQMEVGFADAPKNRKTRSMKLADFKTILKNKTFLLICTQGVAGSIPFAGILFMPTWLEYIGFQPLEAAGLFVIIAISAGAGTVFGGWFGDRAARWSPKRGRIFVAQLSVGSAIPLVIILLVFIPHVTSSMYEMLVVGLIVGFLCTWAGNACNLPIFSEIFEPEIRGSAFSVDRVFEGSIAAFGTYFISLAATAFGFATPPASYGQLPNLYPDPFRLANLAALTKGMFLIMIIPQILCLCLYSLVYITYPSDLKKAKAIMEARYTAQDNPEGTAEKLLRLEDDYR